MRPFIEKLCNILKDSKYYRYDYYFGDFCIILNLKIPFDDEEAWPDYPNIAIINNITGEAWKFKVDKEEKDLLSESAKVGLKNSGDIILNQINNL